ncbi:hypothetical protein [Lacticaseibacillus paracasei]|uniref:hypothetical protein n=1 Tax=Lacticaseibacillus paracasei TaxID=1597 RepID=UPI00399622AE
MAFVELENGNWINTDFIESIFKVNPSGTAWRAGLNHGEAAEITDADRAQILKTAGFVRIKKEKYDEQ